MSRFGKAWRLASGFLGMSANGPRPEVQAGGRARPWHALCPREAYSGSYARYLGEGNPMALYNHMISTVIDILED